MIASVLAQVARGVRDRRPIDRGLRILTYHGVVERRHDAQVDAGFHLISEFRAHLALLRWCEVVSLADENPPATARSRMLRPRVAITFDDGFANNMLAAELAAAAKLPMTVFMCSDNVTHGQPAWPTLLRLVLARGSAREVALAGTRYALDRDPAAVAAVRTLFKRAPSASRTQLWAELTAQLRSDELAELTAAAPSIAMMSWADARALAAAGVTIGSHGATHELHHAAQPAEVRQRELAESKATITRELGRACELFAFPNGTTNEHSPREVRDAGYARGFTMEPRAVRATDDPMLVPRLVPGGGADKLVGTLLYGNLLGSVSYRRSAPPAPERDHVRVARPQRR